MRKNLISFLGTLILIFALIFTWKYVIGGETFKTVYDGEIPPGLPKAIPLVEGEITRSVATVNIYGDKAFDIEIETGETFSELVEYYRDEFNKAGNPESSLDFSGEIFGGDGQFGNDGMAFEIVPQTNDKTKNLVIIGVEIDAYKK